MKKKLFQSLILLAALFLVHQITMAQPPPPHPGGSGNQGAVLEGLVYLIAVVATFGVIRLKK